MKKNIIAGFVLTCLGAEGVFSYIPSRYGNTLTDKIAQNTLDLMYPNSKKYSFLDRGSDERQYCSPGVDLPVCSITKKKYGEYPEYHTSGDNMSLITPAALNESLNLYKSIINGLEANQYYIINCFCEPQLGKRGLYPTTSKKGIYNDVTAIKNLIAYADGTNDLIDISNKISVNVETLSKIVKRLVNENLLKQRIMLKENE